MLPTPTDQTSPQPSETPWIEWSGGACPVDREVLVQVRLRDGSEHSFVASDFDWTHEAGGDVDHDIIAYRTVQP